MFTHTYTCELALTEMNSVTSLSWRHPLTLSLPKFEHLLAGLISCTMISRPDCLLMFRLSLPCITPSFDHHPLTRTQTEFLTSSTRTFSVSHFQPHAEILFLIPIPWLLSLCSCIFMCGPAADYHCLLNCQNSVSHYFSLRGSANTALTHVRLFFSLTWPRKVIKASLGFTE